MPNDLKPDSSLSDAELDSAFMHDLALFDGKAVSARTLDTNNSMEGSIAVKDPLLVADDTLGGALDSMGELDGFLTRMAEAPRFVWPTESETVKVDTVDAIVKGLRTIREGDEVIIDFPSHHDPESYRHHVLYHGQKAKITAVYTRDGEICAVDLLILTGEEAGKVDLAVNPDYLIFPNRET